MKINRRQLFDNYNISVNWFLDRPSMDRLEGIAKFIREWPVCIPRTKFNAPYCIREKMGDMLCDMCPLRRLLMDGHGWVWFCTLLEDSTGSVRWETYRNKIESRMTDITVAFIILREMTRDDGTN